MRISATAIDWQALEQSVSCTNGRATGFGITLDSIAPHVRCGFVATCLATAWGKQFVVLQIIIFVLQTTLRDCCHGN